MTETAFRTLGWGGRLLVIGFAGGSIAKLAANLPLLKGAALVGVDVRQFGEREPELASADLQSLFDLYEKGLLAPKIGRVFPIDDFARAMLTCSQTIGRTVLSMRSGWKG